MAAEPDYIIAHSRVSNTSPIDTAGLAQEVNQNIAKGYVALGGMYILSIQNGYELFQPMTRPPGQGQGGGGTKRRRIRKKV